MNILETYQSLRPRTRVNIYDVALAAGLSGRPWEYTLSGKPTDPRTNTHQNSLWIYGGGAEPYLATVWWIDMQPLADRIVHRGNFRFEMEKMGRQQLDMRLAGERENTLTRKMHKADAYANAITLAKRDHKPFRIAIVHGNTQGGIDAARQSSEVELRALDPVSWWVHDFDVNGDYVLVRGIEPPRPTLPDPYEHMADPADDAGLQAVLTDPLLSDTEKDAIVKMRVGQGAFRTDLINRWHGCAVSDCKDTKLLIASHIKPWRACSSKAERLSPDNGLLLSPNWDKAFDRGFISFDDRFTVIHSKRFPVDAYNGLGIQPNMRLNARYTTEAMKPFLQYHHEHIFLDGPVQSAARRPGT